MPLQRAWLLGLGLLAGCALRGDVRKVELQVEALRSELTRSDSARRAERDSLVRLLAALQAALVAQQTALTQIRGDIRTDLQTVQQQLVPGVRIMTTAGLFGTLKDVEDSEVLIEIAPGVVCRYARAAVAKVIPEGVVPKE